MGDPGLYDVACRAIDELEDAIDDFYWSAAGYDAAVDDASQDQETVERNREHVIRDWIAAEDQRLVLDWAVHDLGLTFTITVRDEEGDYETTASPDSLQAFLFQSMGGLSNLAGMDPHPRYSDEEAGELLAAFQVRYTDLHAAQHQYFDALEIVLDYPGVIDDKVVQSAFSNTKIGDQYRTVETVMQAWHDQGYTPV